MSLDLQQVDLDSEIFGRPTFLLSGVSKETDIDIALERLKAFTQSSYTVCKFPIEEMALIHLAIERGFTFLETQFRISLRLEQAPTGVHDRYEYVKIVHQSQLDEVLTIAGETSVNDRVSRDPLLGPSLSGERYRRLLHRSFEANNEEIWAVMSRSSKKLLTFRSHRIVSSSEVLLLNGGVDPRHKGTGLGVISSHFCFAQLRGAGYRRAVSHVSASNMSIVNLELGYCNFKVSNVFAVLRHVR